jgi:hypothetical protein
MIFPDLTSLLRAIVEHRYAPSTYMLEPAPPTYLRDLPEHHTWKIDIENFDQVMTRRDLAFVFHGLKVQYLVAVLYAAEHQCPDKIEAILKTFPVTETILCALDATHTVCEKVVRSLNTHPMRRRCMQVALSLGMYPGLTVPVNLAMGQAFICYLLEFDTPTLLRVVSLVMKTHAAELEALLSWSLTLEALALAERITEALVPIEPACVMSVPRAEQLAEVDAMLCI